MIGALLLGSSLIVATRMAKLDFANAYLLVVVAAMIVYPGTIHYYAAVLLAPLLLSFRKVAQSDEAGAWWWPVASIGVVFLLLARVNAFAAIVFVWATLFMGSLIEAHRAAAAVGAKTDP